MGDEAVPILIFAGVVAVALFGCGFLFGFMFNNWLWMRHVVWTSDDEDASGADPRGEG